MSVALSALASLSLLKLLLNEWIWEDIDEIYTWLLINYIYSFFNIVVEAGMSALAFELLIKGEKPGFANCAVIETRGNFAPKVARIRSLHRFGFD